MELNKRAVLEDLLWDEDWQAKYTSYIREKAAEHNTYLCYRDEEGHLVREYPASGKIYLISPDWKNQTLLSVRGEPVLKN